MSKLPIVCTPTLEKCDKILRHLKTSNPRDCRLAQVAALGELAILISKDAKQMMTVISPIK